MPGASDIAVGNEKLDMIVYLPSVTYPTLSGNASGSNTFTVPGILPLDCISWNVQGIPAHLTLDNVYVSAANTITLTWGTDSTGISTGSVALLMEVVRPTNANLGASALPSAIV